MNKNWYKLDNAACIYPPNKSSKWMATYRIAVVLKEEVIPDLLQKAVNDIFPRFPTFKVELRSGFFWYYFDENTSPFKIEKETKYPCRMFEMRARKYLFRIAYQPHRIIMEAFHVLADGMGSLLFLNTLIKRYLELNGHTCTDMTGCLDYRDIPTAEESEDSFYKNADFCEKAVRKEDIAYRLPLPKEEPGILYLTHGVADTEQLKIIAKGYGTSIGHFLSALFLFTLNKFRDSNPEQKGNRGNTKIALTADMRRVFESATLRNFSAYLNFGIKRGSYSFNEILDFVKENAAHLNKEHMLKCINGNVSDQRNLLLRIVPLFLKNIALRISFNLYGERLATSTFSNLGIITAPEEFKEHILRYEANIGRQKLQPITLTVLSYKNKTVLTFSSCAKEAIIEKMFFREAEAMGLNFKIDSNRGTNV